MYGNDGGEEEGEGGEGRGEERRGEEDRYPPPHPTPNQKKKKKKIKKKKKKIKKNPSASARRLSESNDRRPSKGDDPEITSCEATGDLESFNRMHLVPPFQGRDREVRLTD